MAFTLKVKSAKKEYIQANNADQIEVSIDILNEKEEVIESRRLGFPLETSEEEIKAELQKFLNTYNSDAENTIKNAELDRQQEEANKTIDNIADLALT